MWAWGVIAPKFTGASLMMSDHRGMKTMHDDQLRQLWNQWDVDRRLPNSCLAAYWLGANEISVCPSVSCARHSWQVS